jgi:protein required for attachment to host cells
MTWILSASRASARIFEQKGHELALVETIKHDAGRQRDRDVDSDRPGRSFDRTTGARHALSTDETPHDHDAHKFALSLAQQLQHAHGEHRFSRLVLVAEPRFLGMLREALDTQTAHAVVASVTKDLEHMPPAELAGHLPELPIRTA